MILPRYPWLKRKHWQRSQRLSALTKVTVLSHNSTICTLKISILTMTITKVTPLHWAAINDRPDVVDLLLDCGADPNCKGSQLVLIVGCGIHCGLSTSTWSRVPGGRLGGTPLHWAATRGATRVAVRWNNHCSSFIQRLVFETSLWQVRLLARSEKADRVEDEAGLLPVHVAASAGQVVKRYTGRAFLDWPPCSVPIWKNANKPTRDSLMYEGFYGTIALVNLLTFFLFGAEQEQSHKKQKLSG